MCHDIRDLRVGGWSSKQAVQEIFRTLMQDERSDLSPSQHASKHPLCLDEE
jgi:hypothetical protein